jgi:hypothetical protein
VEEGVGGLTALPFTFSVENATVDVTRVKSGTTIGGAGVFGNDIRQDVVEEGSDGPMALPFTFSVENATVDVTRVSFETADASCIDSCTTNGGTGVWHLGTRLCVV